MSSLQHAATPCQLDVDDLFGLDLVEIPAAEPDAPAEPRMAFPDWIALAASYYRSLNSHAGDWLAARIDQLAEQARLLGAETPDQFDAREELQGQWHDHELRMEGVSHGERSWRQLD